MHFFLNSMHYVNTCKIKRHTNILIHFCICIKIKIIILIWQTWAKVYTIIYTQICIISTYNSSYCTSSTLSRKQHSYIQTSRIKNDKTLKININRCPSLLMLSLTVRYTMRRSSNTFCLTLYSHKLIETQRISKQVNRIYKNYTN